ncbi:MAG TPA: choice-of-anchor D domain-containing protein [Bryobacteraceae bacterium]
MKGLRLAVIALLSTSAAVASSAYTCTTVTHKSAEVSLTGINNKGQVVGYWSDSQGSHAFLREADGMVTTLRSPDGSDGFTPAGINNLGQIAGPSFIINSDGSYINFAPPPPPPDRGSWSNVQITGINDKGELVGFGDTGLSFLGDTIEAFIRDANGKYRIVDQFVTGHQPTRVTGPINNADTIVEHTRYSDGYLVKADGSKTNLIYPGIPFESPLPAVGSTTTQGLNNSGVTAGFIPDSTTLVARSVAFTRNLDGHYPSIVCPDMPTAGLGVAGINDNGVIAASANGLCVIATPTGIFPHIKFSNTTWNFAPHPIGGYSGPGAIYISNSGPADLHISAIYLGKTGQSTDRVGAFHIDESNCTTLRFGAPPGLPSIPPGGWCYLKFRFSPAIAGWQTAAIYVASDAPDAPEIIRIGGEGIGGASKLQLSNSSWTFAAHPVGETSGNGVIYVYNAGPKTVTFSGTQIVAGAGGALNFALSADTCGSSLSPYKTCALTFHFTPTSPGERTASLNLNDDSDRGPIKIPLYGYGR